MKKSELRQIIREEIQSVLNEAGTSWGDEKRQQARDDDSYNRSRQSFKDRERNAGVEDEDPRQQRDYAKKMKGVYVKAAKGGYMPILYHDPRTNGKTDGKLYRKNRKTGGYFPVKK